MPELEGVTVKHSLYQHWGGDFISTRCACGWQSIPLPAAMRDIDEIKALLATFAAAHEATFL